MSATKVSHIAPEGHPIHTLMEEHQFLLDLNQKLIDSLREISSCTGYSDANEQLIAINNILDREYFTYAAKSSSSTKKDYYPAPERNFEIGARYSF